ncbi:hypothetical protein PRIPAC_88438 [Pristionchus pacificus]|nr:hypothetical protein PRIPAC_88438 [Pristionchus pacificus]
MSTPLILLLLIPSLSFTQGPNGFNDANTSGGKGLSFLPPPHLHRLILKKIIMMELPELRETVTELVEALSQMDNALVVQVKRIEATEKAFSDLEKKVDQQSGLISQVLDLKKQIAIMNGKLEALSKIVIAEWEQVGSSRVKPHTVAKSWDDAFHHCQVYSASLVRINDEDSNRKISDLIQYEPSSIHWIGVEGREHVDRLPFHRFAKPNRVCIALEKGGSWVSRDCSEKLPFICGYEDGSTSIH